MPASTEPRTIPAEELNIIKTYMEKKYWFSGIELLNKMLVTANEDPLFDAELKDWYFKGSTFELRELTRRFGDYWEQQGFRFSPFHSAVNALDSAFRVRTKEELYDRSYLFCTHDKEREIAEYEPILGGSVAWRHDAII